MEVSDIPRELLAKVREQFDRDPQVVRLRVHQRVLQERGEYMAALDVAQRIESLYSTVVYNYMKEVEKQVEQVTVDNLDMPQEDKEHIQMLGVVMFMAAEIINSAIMDVDSVMHKYDKDLHFEQFNDIRQIASMAKEKLVFFQKNSGYMEDLAWGAYCDNMYDMIQSKAKALIRKRRNAPNWGANMKKFNEKK